jgi:Alpha-glutamyl/putrescinyl thymine pyrophosphorylase clade 3
MPQFCRHNRFVARCPICSQELPGAPGTATAERGARAASGANASRRRAGSPRGRRQDGLRVYADGAARQSDDGYRSELVPGLRSSEDARRLAEELAFAYARLAAIVTAPPGAYAIASDLGRRGELERATLLCFLIAYLSPDESDAPFASIETALAELDESGPEGVELDALRRGPRSSYRHGDGARALEGYRAWVQRSGSAEAAFTGDAEWSAERRFARVFERLTIPSFSRIGRFELLVLLGSLEIYELEADSLHLSAGTGPSAALGADPAGEPVLVAAKRVFGIGDPLTLERRARALADACGTGIDALDLALYNWAAPQRATLGIAAPADDLGAERAALDALGL